MRKVKANLIRLKIFNEIYVPLDSGGWEAVVGTVMTRKGMEEKRGFPEKRYPHAAGMGDSQVSGRGSLDLSRMKGRHR